MATAPGAIPTPVVDADDPSPVSMAVTCSAVCSTTRRRWLSPVAAPIDEPVLTSNARTLANVATTAATRAPNREGRLTVGAVEGSGDVVGS